MNLPIELIQEIIYLTGYANRLKMSLVSKSWKAICDAAIRPARTEQQLRALCLSGDIYSAAHSYCIDYIRYPKHLMAIACGSQNIQLFNWIFTCKIDSSSIRQIFKHSMRNTSHQLLEGMLCYIKYHGLHDMVDSLLEGACESGNEMLINRILDHGVARPEAGVYSACRGGNRGAFNIIMSRCGSRLVNIYWPVVFECACQGGDIGLVRLTYKKSNKHVNLKKAMFQVCYSGSEMCLNYVMYIGAKYFNDGLYGACRGGHLNLVKLMLFYGAHDINTGLRCAAENNDMQIVEYMVNKGATAIYDSMIIACRYGNLCMFEYLLGVLTMEPNWYNCYMAAIQSGSLELLLRIVEHLNQRGYNSIISYDLSLQKACMCGHLDIAEYLISKMPDTSICKHCDLPTANHIC